MNEPRPPTRLAVKFVRYVAGFFVGVGLALAPLLASSKPGSLLALFPATLRALLIPISALVMGGVALGVQFYLSERIARVRIRRKFGWLALAFGLSLLALLVLLNVLIVDVPIPVEKRNVRVLVSFSRSPACGCPESLTDHQCLAELGPDDPIAIDSCWPARSWSQIWLALAYLATIASLGGLVGLLILQEARPRRRRPGKGTTRS